MYSWTDMPQRIAKAAQQNGWTLDSQNGEVAVRRGTDAVRFSIRFRSAVNEDGQEMYLYKAYAGSRTFTTGAKVIEYLRRSVA